MKKEDIQIQLESLCRSCPELKGLHLVNADARLGKKVALASTGESGTLNVKTDYLTYSEMYRFLQGYATKADSRLGESTDNLGIIQLCNCDGEDVGLFKFDKSKMDAFTAKEAIEEVLNECIEEDNPLEEAEEILQQKGIERFYVELYAETNVI